MENPLTVNDIYRVFKWMNLPILLLTIITVIINYTVDPVSCTSPNNFYLPDNLVKESCFHDSSLLKNENTHGSTSHSPYNGIKRKHRSIDTKYRFYDDWEFNNKTEEEEHDEFSDDTYEIIHLKSNNNEFIYFSEKPNSNDNEYIADFDSDERIIYETNFKYFPFLLIGLILNLLDLKLYWHYRTKFKRKDFESYVVPGDEIDKDRQLIESFKKINRQKGSKINFKLSYSFLVLALFKLLLVIVFISLPFDNFFLLTGLEEFIKLGEPKLRTFFPSKIYCPIQGIQNHQIIKETVICRLNLNLFYLFCYLLLWCMTVFLLISISICLFNTFVMSKSQADRLRRIRKILPSIDRQLLEPFANDRNSYFIIESLYDKLDKNRFEKLIKLLIDENYQLERELYPIDNV